MLSFDMTQFTCTTNKKINGILKSSKKWSRWIYFLWKKSFFVMLYILMLYVKILWYTKTILRLCDEVARSSTILFLYIRNSSYIPQINVRIQIDISLEIGLYRIEQNCLRCSKMIFHTIIHYNDSNHFIFYNRCSTQSLWL